MIFVLIQPQFCQTVPTHRLRTNRKIKWIYARVFYFIYYDYCRVLLLLVRIYLKLQLRRWIISFNQNQHAKQHRRWNEINTNGCSPFVNIKTICSHIRIIEIEVRRSDNKKRKKKTKQNKKALLISQFSSHVLWSPTGQALGLPVMNKINQNWSRWFCLSICSNDIGHSFMHFIRIRANGNVRGDFFF